MDSLHHRGPDDSGLVTFSLDDGSILSFGHTRLSIIDLSDGGHQPMYSSNGRFVIVFNGEIYNYKELRKELESDNISFNTQSDTEVLLQAWIKWGKSCLKKLIGMFAFSVFDKEENTITCVRDAFGIKPFYYYHNNDSFSFASEINSLKCLLPETPKYNLQRIYDYLVLGRYDSQENTTLQGIKNLLPSHLLTFDITTDEALIERWWWPDIKERKDISFSEATNTLREIFLRNIKIHLRSDVPVGIALSGGIDSSAIVCAVRYLNPNIPINTFSYIASGFEKNEEKWIDIINKHTNAIPHKVFIKPNELFKDIDDLICSQGEPFGGTSIYAQYRIFKEAKKNNFTVILEGQGADELLAGYNGYPGQRMQSIIDEGNLLGSFKFLKNWSKNPSHKYLDGLKYFLENYIPPRWQSFPRKLVGKNPFPNWVIKKQIKNLGIIHWQSLLEFKPKIMKTRRLMSKLRHSLSAGNIAILLRHGDRNSMRWSIESRVPFLTIEMAEFLLSLPENFLISKNGQTKHIFRESMRGIVPDEILDRQDKIGFATPQNDFLNVMIDEMPIIIKNLEKIEFVDTKAAMKEVKNILNDDKTIDKQVWRLFNLSYWLSKKNNSHIS